MAKQPQLLGYNALLGDGSVLTNYQPTLRERATDWLRQMLFTDDREGQGKADRLMNWGETMIPPVGVATGMYDAGNQAGHGNYGTAAAMAGMAILPGNESKLAQSVERKGIRAYHGSPHSFDKFSMDKIGTGEGNQAFSHGLYFAENENIAKGYRDKLIADARKNPDFVAKVDGLPPSLTPSEKIELRDLEKQLQNNGGMWLPPDQMQRYKELNWKNYDHKDAVEAIPGSMYEVNIDADLNAFLDWDKPLSEQPEGVRAALKKLNINTGSMTAKDRVETLEAAMTGDPRLAHLLTDKNINIDGGTLYKKLVEGHHLAVNPPTPFFKSSANVSKQLNKAGIPGVKYLDAGSRGAGDGTRNYVVFDDKLISIVRKYGIAGASAMLGYNIMQGANKAQAKELDKANAQFHGSNMGGGGW